MSDRPTTSPEDAPEGNGGWRLPSKPSLWREIARPSAPEAEWRVVTALPEDVPPEPEQPGTWHLPRPEDTSFQSGQTIQIKPVEAPSVRPEDIIAEIAGQRSASVAEAPVAPEDMDFTPEEPEPEPVRPEEMLSWPELMALRSMEGGAQIGETTEAEEVSADEELSAAEKLVMTQTLGAVSPTTEAPADENARYMAEQLERLRGEQATAEEAEEGEEERAEGEPEIGEQTAANMDFYQQQIAKLQQQEGAAEPAAEPAAEYTPVPESTQPINPADLELARRFRETRQAANNLYREYENGVISYEQYMQRISTYAILDNDQVWWQYGPDTRQWLRYDSRMQQWVPDTPPVPLTLGAAPTETGMLDAADVLAGSLPYLPGDVPGGEVSTGAVDTYGTTGTPVPRPGQPIRDPDHTMVGASWDRDQLTTAAPTLQNMNAIDATMPSPSQEAIGADRPIGSFIERPLGTAGAEYAPGFDVGAPEAESDAYQRERERQQTSLFTVAASIIGIVFACGLISLVVGGIGIVLWYNNSVSPYTNAIDALVNYEPDFRTARIMDANGDLIAELNSREGGARDEVPLDQISPFLIHAVISTENQSFYDDPGFDLGRVVSAFFENLSANEVVQGASTITQQIARNLVLQETEVTADRKIREILVAMEISRRYDKNFILELYLNEVFLGNQSYGVEAASQFYFDKPAAEVNMAEAALLAGLINAPNANDPVINLEQAKRATRESIRRMLDTGCLQFQHGEWATSDEPFCIIANQTTVIQDDEPQILVRVNPNGTYGGVLAVQLARMEARSYRPREAQLQYPHFVNYVLAQIEADYGSTDVMFQRGFTIFTTLNPRMQQVAEDTLRRRVEQLVNNGVETGAVMVTDPQTGAIRAMVGSPDFNDESINGQFDNTRSWQQPGSALKPFLYAAALEGGPNGYYTPATILWDVYSEFPVDGQQPYVPRNFDGVYRGPIPVRSALQNSINMAAVKTLEWLGLQRFEETLNNVGIRFFPDNPIQSVAAAVGANEVRLIDMMKGYGTLANNGVLVPLYTIERITEEGGLTVTLPDRPEPQQVMSPQVAYIVQNILSDDASRAAQFGTNSPLTLVNAGIPASGFVAAKTGTSNQGRDLWTMGFTHNSVVGVWLGTVQDNSITTGVTGFTAASPLWNTVMRAAIDGRAPRAFQNPGGVVQVTVCRETGALADPNVACPTRVTDIAIQGQLPPSPDAGPVQTLPVDSWTGNLANQWCPENVVERTFAAIDDQWAVRWINNESAGQDYARELGLPLPLETPPNVACQQGEQLPTVLINNPQPNNVVENRLVVTGVVSAPNFDYYELRYAPADEVDDAADEGDDATAFRNITDQIRQEFTIAGSELGTWDTRTVSNGNYILRLAVFSTQGGFIYRDVPVQVQNTTPTPTPTRTPSPATDPTAPVPPTQNFPTLPPGNFTPIPFDDLSPTPTLDL